MTQYHLNLSEFLCRSLRLHEGQGELSLEGFQLSEGGSRVRWNATEDLLVYFGVERGDTYPDAFIERVGHWVVDVDVNLTFRDA